MTDLDEARAEEAARLHEAAIGLREGGRLAEALSSCVRAVELFEEAEGDDSPNLANALIEHGLILDGLDRHLEAEAAFDRALGILRLLLARADEPGAPQGPEEAAIDRETLEDLTRLTIRASVARADVVRKRGHLDEAAVATRAALDEAERCLPPDDLLVAEALNALGVICKFAGRFDEAEPLYRRALAIVEAGGGGPDHLATLLHNLGGLAHSRGDFATGEPLARRSIELRQAAWTALHPAVAADREAWGGLLEGLGRLPEAEQAYRESLQVFEATLGPESLEAASSLSALASVEHSLGRREDALANYRRALAIREAKLPPSHFDLGITLNNLGMLLGELGRGDDARAALRRAHAILEAGLGPEHPHTRAAAANCVAFSGG
jgi:tetratricopeptide (TPR) repeat protein